MNNLKLYELIKQSQKNNSIALQSIIEKLTPKINRMLLQVSVQDKEDLAQELKLKIIEIVLKYDLKSTPSFFSFLKKFDILI